MLVIVMENQLLPTHQVCQACLMADQSGQPRWQAYPVDEASEPSS